MHIWTAITDDSVRRQRHRRGARALAALLLTLGLIPHGLAAKPRANFDHLPTGFELIGQHRDLPCESCHANAIFKGTPTDCGACHGIGTTIRATAKPANHILSTDRCASCHTPIAWNPAVNFDHTQTRGSCSTCHNGVMAQGKGPTHIVTDLECDACHTTLTWAGAFFTHKDVTNNCASCHNGVAAQGMPPTHFPIGTPPTPCEGCHSTTNFTTWAGTLINHLAVTAVTCASCHETAAYLGMHPSTNTKAADSRPSATLDAIHPNTGDCGVCHDTTTFANSALRPKNHIPTSAPCSQCHTTAGNYKAYSVTGTHQGVSGCLTCHGPTVAGTFANITIVSTPSNHFPIGSLDCNGSGCHSTSNVNTGGFQGGAASLTAAALTVPGHTTVATAVPSCQTCHETSPYVGMLASTATTAGDSRPQAFDKLHPASGDCNGCHSTSPTFTTNQMGSSAKPATHIPTTAGGAVCHTTAGNYALYVMGVTGHAGITNNCKQCHAYGLSFYNMAPPTLKEPAAGATGHIPAVPPNGTGTIDCVLCHTTAAASFATFAGTVMKHAYVTSMKCMACHETGMQWKTNGGLWRRPNGHKVGQDCGGSGCHNTAEQLAVPTRATVATAPAHTKPATGVTARTGLVPRARTAP